MLFLLEQCERISNLLGYTRPSGWGCEKIEHKVYSRDLKKSIYDKLYYDRCLRTYLFFVYFYLCMTSVHFGDDAIVDCLGYTTYNNGLKLLFKIRISLIVVIFLKISHKAPMRGGEEGHSLNVTQGHNNNKLILRTIRK